MSAATRLRRVRRLGTEAAPLRPETRWESIPVPGGPPYVARLVPVVELIDDGGPAVVVLHTHDYRLAVEVAWPMWSHEHGGPLSRPARHWWLPIPTDGPGDKFHRIWWPVRPGTPGAIPVVEFPLIAGATSSEIGGQR